jgi:hypothetical protein
MFLDQRINQARAETAAAQPTAMASRSAFFSHIYQGLERLRLSLTRRQGDFAEDPSEEGKRAKTSEGS